MISPIEQSPAVRSYLDRVGAKVKSLFTASITKVTMGYEKDVHVIRFARNGIIRSDPEIAPTTFEREAIIQEVSALVFPEQQSLSALSNSSLPPLILNAAESDLFIFRDAQKRIRFIQVRIELDNGDKRYVPQTYWSDGQWRAIEPEEGLPIYNLDLVEKGCRVFLHEGAKAARAAEEISKSKNHPWSEYFSTGVHVGWVGGVHHLFRTRWSEIVRLPGELIIVPDNDFVGRSKVSEISRRFTCPTFCFQLDSKWPASWDVADPIPRTFFREGNYIGPDFEDCVEPCDWATQQVGEADNGRPIYGIREEFASSWVRIQNLRHYAHLKRPEDTLDRDQFNTKVRPFSDVAETSILLAKVSGNICDKVTFMPNMPGGIVTVDGYSCLNQYVDRRIKPIKGDTKPFWDFLKYICEDPEEQNELVRWIATLYSRPDIRMGYGILLLSKMQGVGKSTLLDIMAWLIGKQHVSFPGDAMVQSDFNGWVVNRRLVVVHEIYAGQNWKTYNRLKSLITDENVEANNKHVANYTVPNWTHYAAASNSQEALRMEHDDRRWFVPKISEYKYDRYGELRLWIGNGGVRNLAYQLMSWNDVVGPGETAPQTQAKRSLIDQSMPPDERLILILCERMLKGRCMDIKDIWLWLQTEARGRAYVSPQRIANLLIENGFCIDKEQLVGSRKRQIVWVSANDKDETLGSVSADHLQNKILERLCEPSDVFSSSSSM